MAVFTTQRLRWAVFLILSVAALTAAIWMTGSWARTGAVAIAVRHAKGDANLRAAALEADLDKHRALPIVLASDPDVRAALANPSPKRYAVLNTKLEQLGEQTHATAIYIIDKTGLTVAASNWRSAASFVGSRYGFRPYYREAMARGAAEYFALGTVSKAPGLYLARRLDGPAGPLGVLVVKVEFQDLERAWAKLVDPSFVTDSNGVVLISSMPSWRLRALNPLPAQERLKLQATQQFGASRLDPLPLVRTPHNPIIKVDMPGDRRQVEGQIPVDALGWRVHVLVPAGAAIDAAAGGARAVTALVGLAFVGVLAFGLFLTGRAERQERRRMEAQMELEARVVARTAELSEANARLQREMEERRRAAAELQRLQEQVVQANKLAALGQIAAGVAHEINQPVAAIRTYADNARAFLDRRESDSARENLTIIAGLTERIGAITGGLKNLARKPAAGDLATIDLNTALDGAMVVIGHRPRRQGVKISREGDADVQVLGDGMRIEQVLVNLIQNALDALDGRGDAALRLRVEGDPVKGRVIVTDNGPGLDPEAARGLFTPFVTTKPEGLGLGLVISRDIARDLGGTLEGGAGPDGGAEFVLSLRRAS
ncbi:MAG: sensor histidine kinase [Phenylobacterium sp.]|nr:sensor histidine kinase [Phenylobacterium sp.]